MGDHDGDGIPGWQADRYSVSRMRAGELHNRGTARILPGEARVTNIEQAHQAVDAEYIVERTGDDSFTVRQRSGGARKVVHDGPHAVGEPIPGIAGFEVRLEGRPEIGTRPRPADGRAPPGGGARPVAGCGGAGPRAAAELVAVCGWPPAVA